MIENEIKLNMRSYVEICNMHVKKKYIYNSAVTLQSKPFAVGEIK